MSETHHGMKLRNLFVFSSAQCKKFCLLAGILHWKAFLEGRNENHTEIKDSDPAKYQHSSCQSRRSIFTLLRTILKEKLL